MSTVAFFLEICLESATAGEQSPGVWDCLEERRNLRKRLWTMEAKDDVLALVDEGRDGCLLGFACLVGRGFLSRQRRSAMKIWRCA